MTSPFLASQISATLAAAVQSLPEAFQPVAEKALDTQLNTGVRSHAIGQLIHSPGERTNEILESLESDSQVGQFATMTLSGRMLS